MLCCETTEFQGHSRRSGCESVGGVSCLLLLDLYQTVEKLFEIVLRENKVYFEYYFKDNSRNKELIDLSKVNSIKTSFIQNVYQTFLFLVILITIMVQRQHFTDTLTIVILVGIFPIARTNTGPFFHIYYAATTTVYVKERFWCSRNIRQQLSHKFLHVK